MFIILNDSAITIVTLIIGFIYVQTQKFEYYNKNNHDYL